MKENVIAKKSLNKFSKKENNERELLRLPSLRETKQSSAVYPDCFVPRNDGKRSVFLRHFSFLYLA
jgi:hypothetical protein